jgi:type I restriction enzyme S subunit
MRQYLRAANVFDGRLDLSDVKQMNFTDQEYKEYALRLGDVLLNEGQSPELIGRPAIYRDEIPGVCFQNTLVRFRAPQGLVPEYALLVFRAYLHTRRFMREARITTNIAHLGLERFVRMEFPLPPFAEQRRIVAEVDRHLSVIQAAEAMAEANLNRAERLRQAILRRAFEGKLVPQDPTDGPASVLLERIRAEREREGTRQMRDAGPAAGGRPRG